VSILNPGNRLFVLSQQGQRQTSAPAAIGFGMSLLFLVILGQASARAWIRVAFPAGVPPIPASIAENILGFLPIYLGLWVWLRGVEKRPFASLGFEPSQALRLVPRGALVGMSMILVTGLLAVLPGVSVKAETVGFSALGLGLASLVGYAVQGPAEEALFRGWLLPVIGSRYRPWVGVVSTSILFSLAHLSNTGITLVVLLNLFLFGVFAAFYALAEGGLWGIGAWHAVWNWAEGDLFGFAVSGSQHQGLLFSARVTGPSILTGGSFGPEGGLGTTAVLVAAIVFLLVRDRRRLTAADLQ